MRVAVIGCGSIGLRHLENLKKLGLCDLVAYDPDRNARLRASGKIGALCVDRMSQIWDSRPDILYVCTPHNLHMELALNGAEHGCHLFIEKPLAHKNYNIKELLDIIKKKSLVAMVGCNMRFHPGPNLVQKLVCDNEIGELISLRLHTGSYLPKWRPQQDYKQGYTADLSAGGGVVLDCIHELDLALWIAGPGKILASAIISAKAIGLEVDGLAEMMVHHENGVLSSIHMNYLQRDYHRAIIAIGEKATIYWEMARNIVKICSENKETQIELTSPLDNNQMYIEQMKYFIEHVKKRETTFNNIDDAYKTLNIALSAISKAHKLR